MRGFHRILIVSLGLGLVLSSGNLLQPSASQAELEFGGFKKILKKIFPPCGPGTKKERFVVKGEKVCDNKTGLRWQKSPSTDEFVWGPFETMATGKQNAIDHCKNLSLNGKHNKKQWRLPEVKELISLVDYSVTFPGPVIPPGSPFDDVELVAYWSSTEEAGIPTGAWKVFFSNGFGGNSQKIATEGAWCVSGGKEKHGH